MVIFFVALIAHFFFATSNWKAGFMPGHEFRQAQTAIVSYYIDKQDNFSLLYETPILGKPWVCLLLEVPLYEWGVVRLSRAADIPHYMAARTISLTCFYLALPAFYLLLGRLGLARPRRLFVLALILACPAYIFYSRAFLIDPMVLMLSAWFLLGFVRVMDERSYGWLAVTIVAGTAAMLIKSVMFAIWLLPAAGYGAWILWRDLRAGQGWRVPLKTALWGLATVVVAFGALRWWINLTDPIKAAHSSAYIFTSKNLSQDNWGLLNFSARFSLATWKILLERWSEAIMTPWLIIVGLVAGLAVFPRVRWPVLGLAGVFLLAQLMFPFAYAYQDYYYYTCAAFLVAALAYVLLGILDSRLPRWVCAVIIAVPFVVQVSTYWQGYRPGQMAVSNGGYPFTDVLRNLLPEDSVIIVAGADWAAMIPLYSERKALMIRNGLEYNGDYLDRAFNELADEDVAALILVDKTRGNHNVLDRVVAKFGMDTVPTFSYPIADIYCSRQYIDQIQHELAASQQYPYVTTKPRAAGDKLPSLPFNIPRGLARHSFSMVSPAPFRGYFKYGVSLQGLDGTQALTAHSPSDLWLQPPANATQIQWDFGLNDETWQKDGEKTDGVEFVVTGEIPSGQTRQVYRRVLDPVVVLEDRGTQHVTIPYQPLPGETLQFSSRPNGSPNYDWAYWARILVK